MITSLVRLSRSGALALGLVLAGTAAGAATDTAGSKPATTGPANANTTVISGGATQQVSAEGAHDQGTLVAGAATRDHGQNVKSEGANDNHRLVGAQATGALQASGPH